MSRVKPPRWKRINPVLATLMVGLPLAVVLFLLAIFNPRFVLPEKALSLIQSRIEKQKEIEENLRKYYQSRHFTLESPMVIQDPYGRAPLTALVIFDTAVDTQIQVDIPGKTSEATESFTFINFTKHHEIPVLGLYAGVVNPIRIASRTESGETNQTTVELLTESLPTYLMQFSVEKLVREKYNPGFNFTFEDHKVVFDLDGAIRWYSPDSSFQVFTRLKNGRYLYTFEVDDTQVVFEQDLLGRIFAAYFIRDGIHHDILELPNGNLLITGEEIQSGYQEDFLFEVDPKSGHIVRAFDIKQILDASRPRGIGLPERDWLHLNSISYDHEDDSLIISSRAQSAVVKLSYPQMQIKWILGPPDHWSEKYQPFLLTPVGEGFEWQWSQHHATIIEQNRDTHKLTIQLSDNALYRSFDAENSFSPAESYSRIVQYIVDEARMTIEQKWEYGKSRGSEIFTHSASSAYLLENGNILGTWGNITKDAEGKPVAKNVYGSRWQAKVIEIDPIDNAVIFECTMDVMINYRTFRGQLYGDYAETQSFLKTKINNTTSLDIQDRWELVKLELKYSSDDFIVNLKRIARSLLKSGNGD